MIDEKTVKHIADLARIKLNDKEALKYAKQLSGVLDYMDILNEVNIDGVAETSQLTGLMNVMEEDEVKVSKTSSEELLNCSELPVEDNQIRVLRSIK
jgi:aspartyl-tRNA(Asn)/glutamyl-tRNA(Gln) amidotransferase subunit C